MRADGAGYLAGRLGLIGGHVEPAEVGVDALERTARRELAEETGIVLDGGRLRYLESVLFDDGSGWQVSVTYVADLEAGEPTLATSEEHSAVGWWSLEELVADPRSPDWLPALLRRAATVS